MEKQASLKPLKLKKWLTLPEAAQRLDVTEMDILQFALDGHLILSINFFKTTYAVTGRIIHVSEEEMYALMAEGASTGIYPNNLKWRRDEECDMDFLESIYLGEDNYCFSGGDFINIEEDKVFRINGILDLMMCHHGRTLIEDKLLALVGGEKEERPNVKGIYMKSSTGNICQLRKLFDYKEFQSDFELKIVRLKEKLSCGDITNEEFEKQMNYHEQDRSDHLNKVIHPAYSEISGLPKGSILVIRTDALDEFENLLSKDANAIRIQDSDNDKVHKNAVINAKNRENIFGAAFALVANNPDAFRTKDGRIVSKQVAEKMAVEQLLLFPNGSMELTEGSVADHLNVWINRIKKTN